MKWCLETWCKCFSTKDDNVLYTFIGASKLNYLLLIEWYVNFRKELDLNTIGSLGHGVDSEQLKINQITFDKKKMKKNKGSN